MNSRQNPQIMRSQAEPKTSGGKIIQNNMSRTGTYTSRQYSIRRKTKTTSTKQEKMILWKGPNDDKPTNRTPVSLIQQNTQNQIQPNSSLANIKGSFLRLNMKDDDEITPNSSLSSLSSRSIRGISNFLATQASATSIGSTNDDILSSEYPMRLSDSREGWIKDTQISSEEEEKTEHVLSSQELEAPISINLTETDTISLLHIPSQCIYSKNTELYQAVNEQNNRYTELCKNRPKDQVRSHGVETINPIKKNKEVEVMPTIMLDGSSQATNWDISDIAKLQQERHFDNFDEKLRINNNKENTPPRSDLEEEEDMMADVTEDLKDGSTEPTVQTTRKDATSRKNALARALTIAERAITQNDCLMKQLSYHDHSVTKISTKENDQQKSNEENNYNELSGTTPSISKLWTYSCPETENFTVTSLDWNHITNDLVAASYGTYDFGKNSEGAIMLWTIMNPKYPEKIMKTHSAATSCSFCKEHPYLLAAGMYSGSVAIYDIREPHDRPALESTAATNKHSDAVWGLKWVDKGSEGSSQTLSSISSDGHVKQWSTKKGLFSQDIMVLKRVPNSQQSKVNHTEGFLVSRKTSGLCFDFPNVSRHKSQEINVDPTQYLAGEEDGNIHKCSVSYSEQVLDHFIGHTGPVYKVKYSPFLPHVFLSCSADWTCRLWNQNSSKPVITFHSGHDYIMDIAWCPRNSSVFGSVTRDGRVEIWDLEQSTLDPTIQYIQKNKSYSSLLFGNDSPVLLTGACDGNIDVLKINNITDKRNWSYHGQVKALEEAMYDEK